MAKSKPINAFAAPPKHRGRQRSLAAEAAILKATLTLLERYPLSDITADSIAAKAKVSKATIYKWWPNKNCVALDAIRSRLQTDVPVPDTGSALQDFVDHFKTAIPFYTSPRGKVVTQFLAQSQNDPASLELFRENFQKPRRAQLRIMFDRAVSRGEIRADVDAELIIDLLFGPIVYRLLAGHQAVDEAFASAAVHAVFHGIRAST